jgi:ELWxxDGT repeat protein
VNGTLFFSAYTAADGIELWKSDGTTAGTTLVKDIFPGGYTRNGSYYINSLSTPNSIKRRQLGPAEAYQLNIRSLLSALTVKSEAAL